MRGQIKLSAQIAMGVGVLLFSQGIHAWMPCMPFCDAMCAAPAIEEWGAQGAAAYGEEASAVGTLNSAVNMSLDVSNQQLLNALDASTKILQASREKYMVLSKNLANAESEAVTTLFNDMVTYQQSQTVNAMLSDSGAASPSDGVSLENGEGISKALSAVREITKQESDNQKLAYSDAEKSSAVSTFLQVFRFFKKELGVSSGGKNASDEYVMVRDVMLALYTRALNPVDLKSQTTSVSDKVFSTKAAARYLLGTTPAAIQYGYLSTGVDKKDGASLAVILKQRVNNRIEDPDWYLAIKQSNESGLRRELVALHAEENLLLYQIFQAKERQNAYRAMRISSNAR